MTAEPGRRRVDVVPRGDEWAVVLDRQAQPHTLTPSRAHAMTLALQLAQTLGAIRTIEPPSASRP